MFMAEKPSWGDLRETLDNIYTSGYETNDTFPGFRFVGFISLANRTGPVYGDFHLQFSSFTAVMFLYNLPPWPCKIYNGSFDERVYDVDDGNDGTIRNLCYNKS